MLDITVDKLDYIRELSQMIGCGVIIIPDMLAKRPKGFFAEHPEIEPSCFIYITDGFGPAPDNPPPYPVLWLLTGDGEKPAPWGRELRLRNPRPSI